MGNFLAELKRRHIYRVAAAYAVVAWVLLQMVNNVVPIMQAPSWVGQFCLLLLVLGFPLAVFFAWTRELPSSSEAQAKTTIADWGLIGVLVAVLAAVSYQQFAPSRPALQAASVDAARKAAASPIGAISLAVLPFTNLSGDASQEFFSDGMTEEITAALVKIPDLRVVARTSAFEFKGQNRNIQTIGEQLHATHLIEGSVRKAGDRVRVTVQLIRTDDGTHIWSENYDRQLTDIFAIQEDIARAITTSLRMPLGLKPGENLVKNRSIDPDSHQQYLRALALVTIRGRANIMQAASMLEQVVARNPDYAPAWALLGNATFLLANNAVGNDSAPLAELHRRVDELHAKADAATRRSIALDPDFASGYGILGALTFARGKPLEAEGYFKKAFTLDPNGTGLTHAIRIAALGRVKDAIAEAQAALAVEPLAPQIATDTAAFLWVDGQNDAAIALAKTLPADFRATRLAMMYASMGRYGDAADALTDAVGGDYSDPSQTAARLLRAAPAKAASLPQLPRILSFVYLYVGAPDRVFDTYERMADIPFLASATLAYLWHPSYAPIRKTDRFKAFVRKAGFVEYWRAKGWPDFCHPTTGDDFECN